MKALHPSGPNPEKLPPVLDPHEAPVFTDDLVRSALCTFGPGSAAGLFGIKPYLLQQATRAETYYFGSTLTRACNYFARGAGPEFLRPLMAGGVSIALEKSATAVRPLACGDPIRRLVGKCFCLGAKDQISRAFEGKNYGVGCKGGVEVVTHSLRDSIKAHKGSELGLLKIDFKNAFNMVNRNHFMKKAHEMFPYMSSWTEWCYGKPSVLLYNHEHVIWSESGVQQGDPLGPLYFCCGLNPLVNEIKALNPAYNKWYMDDGGIIGDVELLKKVWSLLKDRGPEFGLVLNPSKCEWSWLDPDRTDPCPIDGVAFVPHSEIQMLGVPLGCDGFVSDFVDKKLLGRLQETVNKLVDFEDSQAASYLLRVSYSIVRAVHFMRTTPLELWKVQAEKFDAMMRKAIEGILGFPMDNLTFAQVCLTPKLGGLGLRRVVEHADLAYAASWHESQRTAKETWVLPAGVPLEGKAQSVASFEFDEMVHSYLVSVAPTDREAQRLRRCAQPHASCFVTAVPSEEDGRDTIMKPQIFRVAVKYRLGVPVLAEEIPCPLCKQTIDVYGDHATCCAKKGNLVTRHNTLRDLVARFATDGLLNPQLEKLGILGATSGRRPADVALPRWNQDGGLAIDVAITNPLTKTSNRLINPCEEYARTQKHAKYDKDFIKAPYSFCAMVWEALGAINSEGEDVIKQILRFAAKQLNREFSSYCGRAYARISCTLQRAVSQAILLRIDGLEFRESIPGSPDEFVSLPSVEDPVASPAPSQHVELNVVTSPQPVEPHAAPPLAPMAMPPSSSQLPPSPPPTPAELTQALSVSASLALTPLLASPTPPLLPSSPLSPTDPIPSLPSPHLAPAASPVLPPPPASPALASSFVALHLQPVAGVLAIKADGNCGFNFCAAVGVLESNVNAFADGRVPCIPTEVAAARKIIIANVEEYMEEVKMTQVDGDDFETLMDMNYGETPRSFMPRISGTASGKDRLAQMNDFSTYTCKSHIRVRVVRSTNVWNDSCDKDLWSESVGGQPSFPTDDNCTKTHTIFAVLNNEHWDLGVVYRGVKLQVVFALDEWQEAEKLLVAFVKSKAPARGESKRQELGPRWVPPPYISPRLREEKSEKRSERQQEKSQKRSVRQKIHSPLPPSSFSSPVVVSVGRKESNSMSVSVGSAHPSRRSSKHPTTYTTPESSARAWV